MYGSTIATTVVGAASLIGAGLWYTGAFRKVKITEGEIQPATFLYVEGTGSYSSVGSTFNKVKAMAKTHGFALNRCAGMYFDDPKVTAAKDLRWRVGLLVEPKDEKLLDSLDLSKEKMKVQKLSKSKSAVGVFPNSFPPLTYMVAAMKVYPAFHQQKEFKLQSGAFEVYDFNDWNIYIHFPQENCQEYMPKDTQ